MERVRRRVTDPKVNRLVVAFLKAGVLAEGTFLRSDAGTPQGGILSPLLANIALSVIEERYERHVSHRRVASTRRNAAPPENRARDARHQLNWLLRGRSAFYRNAWGAKRVLCSLDYYAWWSVFRWLRKKHQHAPVKALKALYPPSKERGTRRGQWHHRGVTLFVSGLQKVEPYRLGLARPPPFAIHHGEPGA